MKKKLSVIFLVLLLIITSVSLIACKKDETYTLSALKIETDGATITLQAGKEIDLSLFGGGKIKLDEDSVSLELKTDKTFAIKGNLMGGEIDITGEWTKKGGKIYLTSKGDTTEVTVKGKTLTMKMDDVGEITFQKQ